ncbi:MAG: DivIVA domain-containing protein [Acidimicrobiales bacterium]
MPEDPVMVSISSQTGLQPEEISRRTFPTARRGADPEAVRRYLEAVAADFQNALDREHAVRRRLVEVERQAALPPELDEQMLLRAVGAETARILQTAHDAAAEVVAKAEARAAEILSEAATVLDERTAAADTEAGTVLDGARSEAVALLDATRSECRRIIREARELRASVLGDLAERRQGLRIQLEELRTGRDSLLGVVDAVGDTVNYLRDRLANAEHEARLAAADAGERVAAEADEPETFDLAAEIAVDLGEEPEPDGIQSAGGSQSAVADVLPPSDSAMVEGVRIFEQDERDLLVDEGLAGSLAGAELYDEEAVSVAESAASTSHRSVDELFARIRADRGADPDIDPGETEGVLGSASSHEAAVNEVDEDPLAEEVAEEVAEDAGDEAEVAEDAGDEAEVAEDAGDEAEVAEDAGDEAEVAEDASEADRALIGKRAALLDPIAVKLARSLKRALQDDQNLLLDALRHASGAPDLSSLVPEEEQKRRLEEAASSALAEAWSAGHGWLGSRAAKPEAISTAGHNYGSQLAGEVTTLLRHRLAEALSPMAEIGDGAADAAGAAYREWRGARVEGAASDFSIRAFSGGAIAGGSGTAVRWVVDDDGPCPDCDDNALAGPIQAGEEFPTGQQHPPVHSGCRCLLVPVTS